MGHTLLELFIKQQGKLLKNFLLASSRRNVSALRNMKLIDFSQTEAESIDLLLFGWVICIFFFKKLYLVCNKLNPSFCLFVYFVLRQGLTL